MVLNLSPLADHLNESLCSLRFATKVRISAAPSQSRCLKCMSFAGEQHHDWYGQEAGQVWLPQRVNYRTAKSFCNSTIDPVLLSITHSPGHPHPRSHSILERTTHFQACTCTCVDCYLFLVVCSANLWSFAKTSRRRVPYTKRTWVKVITLEVLCERRYINILILEQICV